MQCKDCNHHHAPGQCSHAHCLCNNSDRENFRQPDIRQLRLEAKVKAVNNCHTYAMELYDKLVPVFTPLVGQKILKADGSLLAKVEKLLPQLESHPVVHIWRNPSNYTLNWTVKTCELFGHKDIASCTYYETSVYVGGLVHGDTLKDITAKQDLRNDYVAEVIQWHREVFKEAQKKADEAKSALWPFGESDN